MFALVQKHRFRNALWSKSYHFVAVFILEKDSRELKSIKRNPKMQILTVVFMVLFRLINSLWYCTNYIGHYNCSIGGNLNINEAVTLPSKCSIEQNSHQGYCFLLLKFGLLNSVLEVRIISIVLSYIITHFIPNKIVQTIRYNSALSKCFCVCILHQWYLAITELFIH